MGQFCRASKARRNLTLEVTGNSAEWLEGKAGVDKHACKIEYTVFHLLQAGSTFRLGASQTPPFVRRSRERFRAWRRECRVTVDMAR